MTKTVVLNQFNQLLFYIGLPYNFFELHLSENKSSDTKKAIPILGIAFLIIFLIRDYQYLLGLIQIFQHVFAHRVYFVMDDSDQVPVLIQYKLGEVPCNRILQEFFACIIFF